MAMNVRHDKFPYWNKIDTTMLTRASKLVSAATSFPVQYNKAIVGRNAFAHESGIHQDGMLKNPQTYEIMTPEQVIETSIANVTRARNHIDDVEWSAEDGTRSEMDFLCRIVEAVIKAGATTVNIPDTVGYTTPDEYRALFETVISRVPNSDKAIFSVHCHNDLGLAVANSLAGCVGGARQIECAVNGLGERAGNTSLEEVVMAMRVRPDVLPFQTRIDTTKLMRASKLVSAVSSFPVQYNKAIVGRNAFAHESGIHPDGVLKDAST